MVFDSGAGGLSVLDACRRTLPGCEWHYVCDNAALPYGIRDDDWLLARIEAVVTAALSVCHAQALVVACNTASTLALSSLRARLTVPVIGTVPAIKPAAHHAAGQPLALLATSATLGRCYTADLIKAFAGNSCVYRVDGDALVEVAEMRMAGERVSDAAIRSVAARLSDVMELSAVVLGCTHFPLILPLLTPLLPRTVRWFDSADAIARRLGTVLFDVMPGMPAATGGEAGPVRVWATAPRHSRLHRQCRYNGFDSPTGLNVPFPVP
ncbi:glutamate racemase [Larsenimonas rhizosphaerae]|uniref:Glutamate racemase n=1 Tax=Larsenimonas rhizosphaerae TaxID=2944682 RepID=A0AA42CUG0_9GAMM|nr:glutamate racemase [Larsenimonas rhizosphaerae]MCX2524647.1 glutamate racemase [Larsenimonas rhizosphaerae]